MCACVMRKGGDFCGGVFNILCFRSLLSQTSEPGCFREASRHRGGERPGGPGSGMRSVDPVAIFCLRGLKVSGGGRGGMRRPCFAEKVSADVGLH